ncbi:MAG: internalization-related competence protein ComEC/Rec2, partial [Clostridia bacterium]|nr:internalization-related competence protein ComEC/Rec2 [Clostridia bacterium]
FIRINNKPSGYIFYQIKQYVTKILNKFTGEHSGFTKSLVLGDTGELSSSDYNSLKNSGLLHIASVSGLHVSILTGLILILLSSMKRKRLKYILCFLFLFILTGVCGFSPSVLRAVFMTGVTFIGNFFQRKADSLNAFGLAVLLILTFSPFLIISPSFLLSFAATLGMLILQKPLMTGVSTLIFRFFNYVPDIVSYNIISVFILSLSCTIFTLPVSVYFFGSFSVMGVLSNVLTMTVINFTFALCILIVLIGWIPIISSIAYVLSFLINWGVVYIMAVTKFLSGFNISSLDFLSLNKGPEIFIIALLIGFITFLLLNSIKKPEQNKNKNKIKRKYIKICVPILVTLILIGTSIFLQKIFINNDNNLTFSFVNVGQGECAAIIQKNEAVIVDCGGSLSPGENAADYLMKNGVEKIPYVILSHLHEDHTNGIAYLCEIYDIDEIIVPYTEGDPAIYVEITMIAAEEGAKLTVIEKDEERKFGQVSIKLLTNHFLPETKDQNENSIVVITEYVDFKAMLTGDITAAAEKRLLGYGSLLDIDLLGIPHHGSSYSTSVEFLTAATPVFSVISVGKNSYGHPASEVIDRLIEYGNVLITKDCGYVEVKTDGKKMDIFKENR